MIANLILVLLTLYGAAFLLIELLQRVSVAVAVFSGRVIDMRDAALTAFAAFTAGFAIGGLIALWCYVTI